MRMTALAAIAAVEWRFVEERTGSLVVSVLDERIDLVLNDVGVQGLVLDDHRLALPTDTDGFCAGVRGVMVIAFGENLTIEDQTLFAGQNTPPSGETGFQEPDELVKVMSWHEFGMSQNPNGFVVSVPQSFDGTSVFAGWHRKVWIGIGQDIAGFRELVDENQRRTSRNRSRSRLNQGRDESGE